MCAQSSAAKQHLNLARLLQAASAFQEAACSLDNPPESPKTKPQHRKVQLPGQSCWARATLLQALLQAAPLCTAAPSAVLIHTNVQVQPCCLMQASGARAERCHADSGHLLFCTTSHAHSSVHNTRPRRIKGATQQTTKG